MDSETTRDFTPINIAILVVSDTAQSVEEKSGATLARLVTEAGHRLVDRQLVKDDVEAIATCLKVWIDDPTVACIITSGGTGLTGRDVTPEAFHRVIEKEIPGFGEVFRAISLQSVGLATMCSRAMGGIANGTYLFALPGPCSAVIDGWEKILRPMLDRRTTPQNFVDLMPRLRE